MVILTDDDYTTKAIFDYILPIAPIAHTHTLSQLQPFAEITLIY